MTVINNILRLLFPERTTAAMVREASEQDIECRYLPHASGECIALSSYRDPLIRAAIQEIKFHNNEHAARLLSTLLLLWTKEHVRTATRAVPMPLARARYRTRGYNQVARILSYATAAHPFLIHTDTFLIRIRTTKPQTSLDKEERAQNVAGAFGVKNQNAVSTIRGAHILLIDDVHTTGATMRAAKTALSPHHPASVTCIALAH